MFAYISHTSAVLQFQLGVHFFAGGTGACLQKALFEIVAQVRVQNGIDGRIGIAQTADQQEYSDAEP